MRCSPIAAACARAARVERTRSPGRYATGPGEGDGASNARGVGSGVNCGEGYGASPPSRGSGLLGGSGLVGGSGLTGTPIRAPAGRVSSSSLRESSRSAASASAAVCRGRAAGAAPGASARARSNAIPIARSPSVGSGALKSMVPAVRLTGSGCRRMRSAGRSIREEPSSLASRAVSRRSPRSIALMASSRTESLSSMAVSRASSARACMPSMCSRRRSRRTINWSGSSGAGGLARRRSVATILGAMRSISARIWSRPASSATSMRCVRLSIFDIRAACLSS